MLKKIRSYDYSISECGEVVSSKGRTINPRRSKGGWPYVLLFKRGKAKVFFIAVLVASYYLGKRPKGFYLEHKDGNVENCSLSNLQYKPRYTEDKLWVRLGSRPYEISVEAEVRRIEDSFRPPEYRVPVQAKSGHLRLDLYYGGKRECCFVHTLMAEAFIGKRPADLVVNHKDGDPTNNAVSNLEYVTRAQNCKHAAEMGLTCSGEDHPDAKLTEESVREIRKLRAVGVLTRREIAELFGVSGSVITNVCQRKAWKHVK